MEKLQLHLGIVQIAVFFLLKSARYVQSVISKFYWNIIVKFFLCLACAIWGRGQNDPSKVKVVTFYKDKFFSNIYGTIFKGVLTVNGWLNGLKGVYSSYDFLLRWNPAIPLIALEHEKTDYLIYWCGKEYADRKGTYPLIDDSFIGTSKVCGYFVIINKRSIEPRDGNKFNFDTTKIDCVWITGEYSGAQFTVDKYSSGTKGHPQIIYFPPRIMVIAFEAIISFGAVIALAGFILKIWEELHLQSLLPHLQF